MCLTGTIQSHRYWTWAVYSLVPSLHSPAFFSHHESWGVETGNKARKCIVSGEHVHHCLVITNKLPLNRCPMQRMLNWQRMSDCLLNCRSNNEITTGHVYGADSLATRTRNPRLLYKQTVTASGHNILHCSTGIDLLKTIGRSQ